ncbi:sodium/potassium-transporting ATPase subunit beta-2-like [Danaus plexippus]|uniref:sodium/potassium-transporting ATPase subunit beta-2-like n=1 Tax=Danaus plexippus TaxID=13037 RepID=UPI002AB194C8|nr:sodium/potassium-transporting ATPase subunit beta-2-like [Danaus plexippus]
MGADKHNGVVTYNRRPPQRPLLKRIQYGIWNPEERTFLGRTGKRWGVIGLIYLVMYICIVIFFSICMCGMLSVLDERIPYFTLADSIIGNNPGMGHRPLILEEESLIWYDAKDPKTIQKYVDNISEFLAPYENKSLLINQGANQHDCGMTKPPRNEVCSFNLSQLGPCSKENNFGFTNRTPCIIIKLNKIFDWNPVFYNDPDDLPPKMPVTVKQYINSTTSPEERRKVWVSCEGERPVDVETLGPINYYPYPGLSEIYFPYDNTPGYLSPLVAVQLMNPTLHQFINIRCRAWARNILLTKSLKDLKGSTSFIIMID